MITMSGPGAPQKPTVTQGIPNLHQKLQWTAQQNPMGCSKFCCHHWKTPQLQQKHVSQHDAMLNTTYGEGPGQIFVLVDVLVILQKRSEAAVHLSYLQNPHDIPWNIWNPDWFIGILIIAYYNPYRNWVVCHPLYTSISNHGGSKPWSFLCFHAEKITFLHAWLCLKPHFFFRNPGGNWHSSEIFHKNGVIRKWIFSFQFIPKGTGGSKTHRY